MSPTLARRIQRAYPQIYLACHVRHQTSRAGHRLSERDGSVLAHLDAVSPTTAGDLARHLGVGPSTVSEALDRLVEAGLATRGRAGGDRRRVEVRITPAGAERMQESSVLDTARIEQVLARMPARARASAVLGLELLAEAARSVTQAEARARAPRLRRRRVR